ncbi:TPA: phage protein [Streptococcus agalactiae]|jgi:Conserved phage C-terminus (Phg_2220_C).|uniref:conserved phage C-terminal domain-containing protein n=1 Tax=Streptococcus TaxID=1301 RepID=UPI00003FC26F|nr:MULTISPECIES: conserved phage C-terminal domain-containing protein [Streptococcus]APZ82122.1 DNA replication protein [Streptococcus phage Str03]AYJ75015.1 replication initiation protein [Streptococcus phage LF3]QBX17094.1 replication initiation protein [Streptococcus phage Javan33]QBX24199.1 replication initiation protein [Streptococcus phage Javan18]QBX31079.1 replication initiation protein [Streptococcus phage Javan6]
MAQRRMFSRKITETDRFLEMPLSSQALYFHLNMGADDEGFIDKAKTIQRTIGASDDDMKLLIAKGFLIPFDSGVVVIRHWRIHNYIQSDRFQSTLYQSEKAQLEYDKSKTASLKPIGNCIQNVSKMETQVRLSKGSLDKDSLTTYPTVSDNEEEDIPYKEIISYLNEKANRNYRPNIQKNKTLIKARWSEGFRLDDFKHVIDTTVKDWSGTKYEKYLRPETLFGSKFEGYLNQAPRIKTETIDGRLGF